jgi:hypothetical protein
LLKKWRILGNLAKSWSGGKWTMIRFLFGVVVGVLIFFFFLYFGGGKSVKKVGEGLTDTGKKMEVLEQGIRKGKEDVIEQIEKRIFKKEKETKKKGQ